MKKLIITIILFLFMGCTIEGITLEQYNEIQLGMKIEDVKAELKIKPNFYTNNKNENGVFETLIYSSKCSIISIATFSFKDGVLIKSDLRY